MPGFTKTGLLQGLSLKRYGWFGTDFTLFALAILAGVGDWQFKIPASKSKGK